VPFIWEISPHLYKFKGPRFFPNFTLILADNGHALAVDCGLFEESFLNTTLDLMRERLGLKKVDAVLISHMHGDHFLQVPVLQKKYGTEVWALERMVPQLERPKAYDYAALIPAYDIEMDSLKVDRVLHEGETFTWEGFEFTADWMPGQTEFAMGLHGKIDGRYVVFTGDNIFADPDDVSHNGHEAVVSRNSAILEEGYILGAQFLKKMSPDIIMGGHSYVMDNPGELINRYYQWSLQMRDQFKELSSLSEYKYWFDPYWVKAEPYRSKVTRGDTVELKLHVRNFSDKEESHVIEIHTPPGIFCNPCILKATVNANSIQTYPVGVYSNKDVLASLYILGLDVTLNGKRFGELFDVLIEIQD
jgi:glyoxylase-like metal-dependent hydrolase (beta-lactamase superfamily II)